jgi:hypothetical protein
VYDGQELKTQELKTSDNEAQCVELEFRKPVEEDL